MSHKFSYNLKKEMRISVGTHKLRWCLHDDLDYFVCEKCGILTFKSRRKWITYDWLPITTFTCDEWIIKSVIE